MTDGNQATQSGKSGDERRSSGRKYSGNGGNSNGSGGRFNGNGKGFFGAGGAGYNGRSFRGGMNPNIMAANMQWQGYYAGQPMYFSGAPGSVPIHNASNQENIGGRAVHSSPVKKIEITTKDGEQLDLDALHGKHHKENSSADSVTTSESSSEAKSETPASKEASALTDSGEISEAERNKRMFLEQIRLRKEALEKKKHASSAPVEETKQEEVSESAEAEETKVEEETAPVVPEKKEVTFADKLKIKKAREAAAAPAPVVAEESLKNADEEKPSTNETKTNDEFDEETKPAESGTSEENQESSAAVDAAAETPTQKEAEADNRISVTEFLTVLNKAEPIEDIYNHKYPEGSESPDIKYKKEHIKYTYGPAFLLQFKDKINVKPDPEWLTSTASKIIIPPNMGRNSRPKDGKFGLGSRMGSARDFGKAGSLRNMDGRSNSRNSSKRKSKRGGDDRRSNRGYTSRKDRERAAEEEEKPKEEVAPLVPSANRWVPKSRAKKTEEKKLAPDGVTELLDAPEVESKTKSLLNKLTLEKFEQISGDVLAIANQSQWEDDGATLNIVIEELFKKACDEPHWSSMYAQLCGKLVKDLNQDISDKNNEGKTGPKLILHYLVVRCHTEFQKGWSDKLPTNPDGTPLEIEMMSEEYYQAAAAKRRGLGLVRFIGHLYRLNLLTGKMMFECFRRLMKDLNDNPSEEVLESVIELLLTVGEQFETDSFSAGQATLEGSALLDSLFDLLQVIIDSGKIISRIKFKLIDLKESREKNWSGLKKDEGPKTITQIHEEEERQRHLKEMRNSSRSASRRNMNNMGNRTASKRDIPSMSKDSFITTRSSSARHSQRTPVKEEPKPQPQKVAANMFNALMGSDEEEE